MLKYILRIFMILALFLTTVMASRVISIGSSITETIIFLGHEDSLVAIDMSSTHHKDALKGIPNIGFWQKLPKEGILSMKPDIIIASEQAKPKEMLTSLSKYGIKTYIIDDKPTIASAKKKILQIAKVFKEDKKVEKLIENMDIKIQQIQKSLQQVQYKPKVLFLFSRGDDNFLAVGKNTKVDAMIKLAGAENVVTSSEFSKISNEAILKINPDVILFTIYDDKKVYRNNKINSINAMKNAQVFYMDMALISGFTLRLDQALEELTCKIHHHRFSYCQ